MIKLGLVREDYWIDLPREVRVKVRPLTTAVFEAARSMGAEWAGGAVREYESVTELGGQVQGLPDLSQFAVRAGYTHFFMVCALGEMGIVEWDGVLDSDGAPAAVNPANIRNLMSEFDIAQMFMARYTAPIVTEVGEGNGSAPRSTGKRAAARNIAGDARKKSSPAQKAAKGSRAKRAPADGARGSKTGR